MNTQFMLRSFMLVLGIMLMACQSNSVVVSKGKHHSPSVHKSERTKQICSNAHKPQRSCWASSQFGKHGGGPKTFILAMGANTGKLKQANQDARQFKKAIQEHFNVPSQQVCLLENVYRAEFEGALQDLKGRVKKNDRVIIFFSGHGSYVRDDNGDEKSDRLDDVLITLDIRDLKKPNRSQVVTDDCLVEWVNALPTQCIITFIDACHAGGMYMKPKNDVSQTREKFFAKGELGTFARPLKSAYQKAGGVAHINGVVFAAAQESQKAWEDNKGGVFTTTFLGQLKHHPRANLKQVFDYTVAEMQNSKRTKLQHPKFIGKYPFCSASR